MTDLTPERLAEIRAANTGEGRWWIGGDHGFGTADVHALLDQIERPWAAMGGDVAELQAWIGRERAIIERQPSWGTGNAVHMALRERDDALADMLDTIEIVKGKRLAPADPNLGRCQSLSPDGWALAGGRCGLTEGHDGDHTLLSPSGVPWGPSL